MRQKVTMILGLTMASGLILFSFNNCDGYSVSPANRTLNSVDCAEANCDAVGLELTSDVLSKTISIPSNTNTFALSGSCLSGDYTETLITWKISRSQSELINTVTAGGEGYYAVCDNGRYQLNVKVPCPGITANATGCFGLTDNADLEVEIFGVRDGQVEVSSDRPKAQVQITLIPSG